MSDEHYALSTSPAAPPPTEADYDAIFAAVMETLRGRWFLAEFARRNRQADTQLVLAAIERLEGTMRGERADPSFDRIRTDIREMARAIAATRHEIAAIRPDGEHSGRIGEATEELDQIVQTTEQATSNILAAAETIQETAWTLREHGVESATCDDLDRCSTDIYLACSFQDLTGQRTRKVIQVLRFLEGRINAMVEILGGDEEAAAEPGERAPRHAPVDTELDQDEIDRVIPTTQAAARTGAAHAQTFAQTEEIEPSAYLDASDPPFASVSATDSFMPDLPAPETEIDATALLELELAVSLAVTPEPALVEAAQAALDQAEVTPETDADGRFTPQPADETDAAFASEFESEPPPEEEPTQIDATAELIAEIAPQTAEMAAETTETPSEIAETTATAEIAALADLDAAAPPEDILDPDITGPTAAAEPDPEAAAGERRGPPDTKALLADLLAIIRPDGPDGESDEAPEPASDDEPAAAADVAFATPAHEETPAQDDEAEAATQIAPSDGGDTEPAPAAPERQPINFLRPSEPGALSSAFVIVPLALPESELAVAEPHDAAPDVEDRHETALQETAPQETGLAEPPQPDATPDVAAPEIASFETATSETATLEAETSEAETLEAETLEAETLEAETLEAETRVAETLGAEPPEAESVATKPGEAAPAAAELFEAAPGTADGDDARSGDPALLAKDIAPEPAATALADTLDDVLLPETAATEPVAPTASDIDAAVAPPILDLDDDVLLTEDEPPQATPPLLTTAGRWDDDTPLLAPPSHHDHTHAEHAAVDRAVAAYRMTATETADDDETAETSIADVAADDVAADELRAENTRTDDEPTDDLLADDLLADDVLADDVLAEEPASDDDRENDERADGEAADDAIADDDATPEADGQSYYGPLAAAAGFHAPPPRNDDGRDAIAAQATGVTPMAADASEPMAAPSFGAIMEAMAEALAADPAPAVGQSDPLDAVRAMSAEERIALFS